jgi:hypothetical protein
MVVILLDTLRDRETGFILTCPAGKDIAAGPFG